MTDETGFSTWTLGEGAVIHEAHRELACRFMRATITPQVIDERGWPKQRSTDAEPIFRAAASELARKTFAQRVAARRRERAEGVASAAD